MVINKLSKYKSLTFPLLYIIGLSGCSSYGSDMNMASRGQGGDQWGRARGRGRAADRAHNRFSIMWRGGNVRQDFEQMLADAIRVRNAARAAQNAYTRVDGIFETLAEQNENLIRNLDATIEEIETSLEYDHLSEDRHNRLQDRLEPLTDMVNDIQNELDGYNDNVEVARDHAETYRLLRNTYDGIVRNTRGLIARFNKLG